MFDIKIQNELTSFVFPMGEASRSLPPIAVRAPTVHRQPRPGPPGLDIARASNRRQNDGRDPAILLGDGDGDGASIGDFRLGAFRLGAYGGAVVEIKPGGPGVVHLELDLASKTSVDVRALDACGGECASAARTSAGGDVEATIPFPVGCHYVAVVGYTTPTIMVATTVAASATTSTVSTPGEPRQ